MCSRMPDLPASLPRTPPAPTQNNNSDIFFTKESQVGMNGGEGREDCQEWVPIDDITWINEMFDLLESPILILEGPAGTGTDTIPVDKHMESANLFEIRTVLPVETTLVNDCEREKQVQQSSDLLENYTDRGRPPFETSIESAKRKTLLEHLPLAIPNVSLATTGMVLVNKGMSNTKVLDNLHFEEQKVKASILTERAVKEISAETSGDHVATKDEIILEGDVKNAICSSSALGHSWILSHMSPTDPCRHFTLDTLKGPINFWSEPYQIALKLMGNKFFSEEVEKGITMLRGLQEHLKILAEDSKKIDQDIYLRLIQRECTRYVNQYKKSIGRTTALLPNHAHEALKTWKKSHSGKFYASKQDMEEMAFSTGLCIDQVKILFNNDRSKILKENPGAALKLKGRFSSKVTKALRAWQNQNQSGKAQPNQEDSAKLMACTKLNKKQLTDWFNNHKIGRERSKRRCEKHE